MTLDENIADNGGIREALIAYRKFVATHGEELKLPGLEEFSNEQMYYLAFANVSRYKVYYDFILRNNTFSHCHIFRIGVKQQRFRHYPIVY